MVQSNIRRKLFLGNNLALLISISCSTTILGIPLIFRFWPTHGKTPDEPSTMYLLRRYVPKRIAPPRTTRAAAANRPIPANAHELMNCSPCGRVSKLCNCGLDYDNRGSAHNQGSLKAIRVFSPPLPSKQNQRGQSKLWRENYQP
jgi:hypothetical protein